MAEFDLRRLAQGTGAGAYFLDEVTAVRPALTSIATELRAKYSLAYTPINMAADSRFRHIDVRVVSNPAYHAKARAGYTVLGSPAGAPAGR